MTKLNLFHPGTALDDSGEFLTKLNLKTSTILHTVWIHFFKHYHISSDINFTYMQTQIIVLSRYNFPDAINRNYGQQQRSQDCESTLDSVTNWLYLFLVPLASFNLLQYCTRLGGGGHTMYNSFQKKKHIP